MSERLEYIDSVELFKKQVDLKAYQFPLGDGLSYGPEAFGQLARVLIGRSTQENFIMCMYDGDNRIAGYSHINKGHETQVPVDLFSAIRVAVIAGARRVAVAHNHPILDLTPSQPDMMLTLALIRALAALQIELMDHVIVNAEGHRSIRQVIGESDWRLALSIL